MKNGQNRLRQAQEDVEEVKVIMLDNLNKADERSTKLGELEIRAENLEVQSKAFSKTSTKVKRKKQWENQKYKVIIAAVVVTLVAILAIILFVLMNPSSENENPTTAPEETKAGLG